MLFESVGRRFESCRAYQKVKRGGNMKLLPHLFSIVCRIIVDIHVSIARVGQKNGVLRLKIWRFGNVFPANNLSLLSGLIPLPAIDQEKVFYR